MKSPCDLLILRVAEGNDPSSSSSSVKPSGVVPAPRHSKWAQSWAPKPPHEAMKEVGSVCTLVVATSSPQSSPYWHVRHIFFDHVALYASDNVSQTIVDCWAAPAPFIFHLPVKYYSSVVKHCLCDHFPDNASIFFFIISGDVCIVLLVTETHLICSLLPPKEATLDEARKQRVWMILSSRKAGFISSLFVCPGVEDSWQPPICLWWTSISLCWIERQWNEQVTSSAGSEKGWAIAMNIMCKYERKETKGCFCYDNVVIGADWALIRCVRSHMEVYVHACVCAAASVVEMTQWGQTFMLSSGYLYQIC